MRDFDAEYLAEDRDFRIGGEVFRWRYVRPEVMAALEDQDVPDKQIDAVKIQDDVIKQFLETTNGAAERWDKLRKREENPVSVGEFNALLTWLFEVQSGRPTQSPAPSAPGRGTTARSSRAGSS